MIIKDLGAVSAYAYAVEKGYTGTEEEFATLMASYATVAEEAAESAESASQSASTASASAQTATTKAGEASTSATQASASATSASQSASTATTKASEASASASTASTKASEASASATTASSKASEASQSASDAQTAQGLAESARDDAVDAKTDAESARDLAQQYAESIDPENIYSAYATDTASGSVASFADGADDIPLKSCVVAIEPAQSGSGDPSPTNVRPISGWTGAHVWRAGKNLFNLGEFATRYPDVCSYSNDTLTVNSEAVLYNTGVPCYLPSGTVVNCAITEDTAVNVRVRFVLASGGITEKPAGKFPQVLPNDVIAICFNWSTSGTFSVSNFQAELGSTATDYEPYTGNTYSITFPSEAGTVYGGTLDVTNGVLTVDRAMVDLGTLTWGNHAGNAGRWIADLQQTAKPSGGYGVPVNAICSAYKTVTQNALFAGTIGITTHAMTGRQVFAYDDNYTDATAFKTAMSGVQFCYELATATTYTLAPTEIKSLLGDNNIWADAGNTEVTYRADTKLYIDKKIAEVINALS